MDKEKVNNKSLSYKTVFVQNVPLSCTNEHLKEIFSTAGSIQEAFVVPPKDREECIKKRQSLVAFVSYFSHDDAEKAAKSRPGTFIIEGRSLKVKFANKKKFSKNNKTKGFKSNNENDNDSHVVSDEIANFGYEMVPINNIAFSKKEEGTPDTNNLHSSSETSIQKQEVIPKTYSVSITGFPDSYTIKDFAKIWKSKGFAIPEKFSISSKEIIGNDDKQQEAVVEMDKKQAALKVLTNLSGMVVGNNILSASLVLDPNSKEFKKTAKRSRMIIRNLSFQCTDDDLREIFSK